ncbi:MAG: GxxExxY protein [Sedimentisphaerales bacterium]|nr:GxxExxY protein [Sedimentisphaerales bacterium]
MIDTNIKAGGKVEFSDLSNKVIGCAIEVHKALGPGLLESAYRQCLCHELRLNNINFHAEKPLPINYRGCILDCGYRIDILVENEIIIELKSVEKLNRVHEAQILYYMKLANIKQGFLVNFNVTLLKDGQKALFYNFICFMLFMVLISRSSIE